ncbi:prolyl oligopeptidase family serine peptidase [Sphingobacterium thalpophilum]|uniref:prolyl oligopeptidase family serine peptidase n=1 Tax=Sphingobacterium thalpophilum TaxID=259 RepID=UPI003DA52E49
MLKHFFLTYYKFFSLMLKYRKIKYSGHENRIFINQIEVFVKCGGVNDSDTTRICRLRDIPILTYHGTADDEISIQETERIAKSLKKCDGKITFHRLKGEGHGIQYLYDTEPWIYEWMLMQRKLKVI